MHSPRRPPLRPSARRLASPPPFHEKYLPEILRHEDGSATWEALTKFFADHPEEHLRVSYLRLRFGEVLHQYPASDGTTIGFRGFPDQFHVWEGNYLNPTAITRLTWGEVCLLAEKEIARDTEQAIPAHEAEAGADEARTPDSPEVPPQPEIPTPDRHGALTQADIDAALRDWNGDMESKRAVVRYMKEHGREKDTAAWLQQEYGDNLPAFPGHGGTALRAMCRGPRSSAGSPSSFSGTSSSPSRNGMNLRTLTRWRYGSGWPSAALWTAR